MENKRTFIKKELEKKDFTHKDAVRAIQCWFVVHTEKGGYIEEELTMHKWEDGSITISDDTDVFISINDKETLDVLRELLK